MAKIGSIKVEERDGDSLILTEDQSAELSELLSEASSQVGDIDDDKYEGQVTLTLADRRVSVGTAKVRKDSSDSNR